jgi:hypothetical protein
MKNLFLVLLLATLTVFGAYSGNFGRDLKLPSQQVLEKTSHLNCAAAATNYILTTNAGATSAATATVTSFTHQPDVPRVLSVTPTGTTADVKAGSVLITGTNERGEVVTDSLAFLENASTATTGTVAFDTVTSIRFPAEDSPYTATWTVGTTDKLGLNKCIAVAGDVAWATADGTYESTRPTCTADVDEMEKNVCDPNTACNGAVDFTFYFIQNFRDL